MTMDKYIFIQADSSQAEGRVVALLSDDEEALEMYETHDVHALTASWFVGGTEETWSKKILGYEHPNRFFGKTARHAGNYGASKKRLATEANTQARKYKIDFRTTEYECDKALNIFHSKNPKIREVFHNGIIEQLREQRFLTAPIPYGIDSRVGGKRQFFERWGDELFRMAFSYIPQRAVSDNTKAAGLRLKKRIKGIRIILESHDALLFMVREKDVDEYGYMIKEEFERAIRFDSCSLPRRDLVIPCELEIGENYMEFKKFKFQVSEVV